MPQCISVGWIILDKDGNPYRPKKSSVIPDSPTQLTKIYTSFLKAKWQALRINGSVKEVFYEV